MTHRRPGRPTILMAPGNDVHRVIVKAVKDGAWIKDACLMAGVTESTFRTWMRLASEGKEPFVSFRDEVMSARAHVRNDVLKQIMMIGVTKEDWRALAWLAEKASPKELGALGTGDNWTDGERQQGADEPGRRVIEAFREAYGIRLVKDPGEGAA